MSRILYIIVVPTSEDATLFQGWCRTLTNSEFLSLLTTAATAPFDTGEIFLEQEALISRRADGVHREVITLGDGFLDMIPEIAKDRFCIIITPCTLAKKVVDIDFGQGIRPIIATTNETAGALKIPFDEIENPIHLLDRMILEKIEETETLTGHEIQPKQLRDTYTRKAGTPGYGSGSTLANNIAHYSLGIMYNEERRIKADKIENFKTAISESVESLLSTLGEKHGEAIVYAPAIKAFLYNTNSHLWNQILRQLSERWQKDMIKNGLIKNPGYSGISHPVGQPVFNPYKIPYLGEILHERQSELALTNHSIALLASSECIPAIRLPNAINLHTAELKEIEFLHKRSDQKAARQLQTKFKALSDSMQSEIGPQLEQLIASRFSSLKLCSDAPLEWIYLGKLPLMISHEVSKICMTPGNMLLQQSAIGYSKNIPSDLLKDILVIRSFQNHDRIKEFLETGINIFPLENGTKITFKDVNTIAEVKDALNSFKGAIVIFDCHGDHSGNEGGGWLQIGKEKLNSWELFDQARVPPIVMLSACSTAPITGSHVTVANGFIRSGASSVIGTFLPVDAKASSAFISRIIYRIDAFLPAIKKLGYEAITWRSLIASFMRMSYATDALRYFHKTCELITLEQYLEIHMNANSRINSMRTDWYDELLQETALASGSSAETLLEMIKDNTPLMETMLYSQQGRPELINIIL